MTRATARGARTAAIGVALLLAASCTAGEQTAERTPTPTITATSPPEPTTSPTPTSESPTPTPTSTTRPEPTNEPPPPLDLVGEDFEAIVRSRDRYGEWAFSNPAPGLLDAIYHPDCTCYEANNLLEHYHEHGLRWVGPPLTVTSVEVLDHSVANTVILRVVRESAGPAYLVDADGDVHDEVPRYEPFVQEDVYVRDDATSPWLLIDFIDRGPVDEKDPTNG